MIAIAHFIAISCYLGAAALAAVPFARPVKASVRGVTALLATGVVAHVVALLAFVLTLYLLILCVITAAPFIPLPFGALERSRVSLVAVWAARWVRLREQVRQARPALLASLWQSLAVQFLSAGSLWIGSLALGVSLSYPVMLAAAAPIFVMAALPIGVAGFGTRELAAVLVLGFAGVPADQATATALLYGMAAVLQGIAAAPLFLVDR